jgi:hypothetical protein
MEITHGRLRATLVAGKIAVTEEALTILNAGLTAIGQGYDIAKFASRKIKTDTHLEKDLSRLHVTCRTFVDVLYADISAACQLEAMLSDPWRGSQIPRLVGELRSLSSVIETALAMAAQGGALKKRQQNPETWFFLAVHDLFSTMTVNDEPGNRRPPTSLYQKLCSAD